MASKSKRTAARQSSIQSRKKRKDGAKAAVSTIVRQNLTAVNNATTETEESLSETKPTEHDNLQASQKTTAEPSLIAKPQTATKKSKKLVRVEPEQYVKAELARIATISVAIVGLLFVFSAVI